MVINFLFKESSKLAMVSQAKPTRVANKFTALEDTYMEFNEKLGIDQQNFNLDKLAPEKDESKVEN